MIVETSGSKTPRKAVEDAIATKTDTRIPGELQCKYCPALGTPNCPETCKSIEKAVSQDAVPALPYSQDNVKKVAELHDMTKLASKAKANLEEWIRRGMEEAPEAFAGQYEYKKGKTRTTLTDPQEVYKKIVLQEKLVSPDDFMQAVDVKLTGVEKVLKPVLREQGMKVKEIRPYLLDVLAESVEQSETAPSLTRV